MKKEIVVYQGKDGEIALKGDVKRETIWANQAEIVKLFNVDQSVVSRHIRKIFKDGEIEKKSNMQKMHIANSDKPVAFYSLDVILAVEMVKKLLPAGGAIKADDALELIKMFAGTWLSRDAYDKSALPKTGANKKQACVTADKLSFSNGERLCFKFYRQNNEKIFSR